MPTYDELLGQLQELRVEADNLKDTLLGDLLEGALAGKFAEMDSAERERVHYEMWSVACDFQALAEAFKP
jgi:hypothetical protein